MGQRAIDAGPTRINSGRSVGPTGLSRAVFLTDFGWFGICGRHRRVSALTIGHPSADEVRAALGRRFQESVPEFEERDWFPELRKRLQSYAAGVRVDFSEIQVSLPESPPFQQQVIRETCRIPYGETVTYGELAARSGSPKAARAVGNVMASNRIPIIIPCHRVVAAARRLGGFSAPQGVDLKRQLLAMESS